MRRFLPPPADSSREKTDRNPYAVRTRKENAMTRTPRIAVSMGDPAGIGPELVAAAAAALPGIEMVLVGDPDLAARDFRRAGLDPPTRVDEVPARDDSLPNRVVLRDAGARSAPEPGRPSAETGRAAYRWLEAAAGLALEKRVDAVVTGPVSKETLRSAGFRHPGQTEFLADLCGVPDFAMLLVGGPLAVLPVTRHVALRSVADVLRTEEIVRAIGHAHDFARRIGRQEPRIAVAALNPHAGDGGMFGSEEAEIIAPAIAAAAAAGKKAAGPIPADALFHQAREGLWDVVVCMYHDQGLIPLKMLAFHEGVNITLGLPIVRTSPDHGTAFDIAGRGKARPDSMISAFRWALRLTGR